MASLAVPQLHLNRLNLEFPNHVGWSVAFQPDEFRCRSPLQRNVSFVTFTNGCHGASSTVWRFKRESSDAWRTWPASEGECEAHLDRKLGNDSDDGRLPQSSEDGDLTSILEILRRKGEFRYHKQPQLKALRLRLDPDLVLKVITNESITPLTVWKFFVWAKKQMKYKHTSGTYNAMISILCDIRKFTSIFYILEDMHKGGCSLTAETCMKMAKTFGKAGLVERSLHAMNHMTRLGSPPTARQYSLLIKAFQEGQHYYKAYIIYTEMVKSGCEVDAHTYKMIIRGFERAGVLDLAIQLYDDMLAKGYEPDAETSSILITVLCKEGRVDDAVCLFETMKAKGIRPNVSKYNILIDYLVRDNKEDEALRLFHELRCLGSFPDRATVQSLVECLRNCGRTDDADRCEHFTSDLIHEVKRKDL